MVQHNYYDKKAEESKKNGIEPAPFCTNVWCQEERRHESATESIAQAASGIKRQNPTTYEAENPGDFLNPNYALKHLIGRNSSEWNANSVYLWLRSHSKDGG